MVWAQGFIFNVQAAQSASYPSDFLKEKSQVGANILNKWNLYIDGLEDEDKSSHEEWVEFGEEDQVEHQRKGADIDNFEGIVEKIFGVRASNPIFFLDGKDVYHHIFELYEMPTGFFTESPKSPKRVTENRDEVDGQRYLSREADEAEEQIEEDGNHPNSFGVLEICGVIRKIHCPI